MVLKDTFFVSFGCTPQLRLSRICGKELIMKPVCLLCAALFLSLPNLAHADYIHGAINFDPESIPFDVNGDGVSVNDPSGEFRITEVKTGAGRGFFKTVSFPKNVAWGDFDVRAHGEMLGSSISIANADFGTFTGIVISDEITPNVIASSGHGGFDRTLYFAGIWSPGSNSLFNGYRDPVNTFIRLALSTNAFGSPSEINPDILLVTNAVPEPGSALVIGVLAGVQIYRRRRRHLRATVVTADQAC